MKTDYVQLEIDLKEAIANTKIKPKYESQYVTLALRGWNKKKVLAAIKAAGLQTSGQQQIKWEGLRYILKSQSIDLATLHTHMRKKGYDVTLIQEQVIKPNKTSIWRS